MAIQWRCIEVTTSDDWARFKFSSVPGPEYGTDCPVGSILVYFTNHAYFGPEGNAFELNAVYDWSFVAAASLLSAPLPEESQATEETTEPSAVAETMPELRPEEDEITVPDPPKKVGRSR